jgi:hypothetical protein
MKADSLHACLRHWSERQRKGEIAFHFRTVQSSDLRISGSKKKCPSPQSDNEDEHDSHGNAMPSAAGGHHGDHEQPPVALSALEEGTGKGKARAVAILRCVVYISDYVHIL